MNRKILLSIILISFISSILALPINVSIVGNIDNPGVYILDTNNRLSQAIQLIEAKGALLDNIDTDVDKYSSGLENSQLNAIENDETENRNMLQLEGLSYEQDSNVADEELTESEKKISYKNIVLIRNGKEIKVNLQEFFLSGNLAHNPYLMNDDIIRLYPIVYSVEIEGAVNKEGEYEITMGDKLSSIIDHAFGFTADADLKHIIIDRYSEEDGSLNKIYIDYNSIISDNESSQNIILQHNDLIRVFERPVFNQQKTIEIKGLVKYPGTYSIDDNSTLLDILEQAGGPLNSADLTFALLIDKQTADTYDPDLDRLMKLNMSLMTTNEYSYYQAKLREISGKHYVNIKKLWESRDAKYNRPVKNGDLVLIKEPILTVNVSGAINNAGLQPWEEDLTWEEYVTVAGGFIPSANEGHAKVIRYQSGVWIDLEEDTKIYPGDEIFIPEHKDMSVWDYVVEGLAVTAQVMTIILGVHTLTK
jgi:protein involved in polysaccharide export with SLBB domain